MCGRHGLTDRFHRANVEQNYIMRAREKTERFSGGFRILFTIILERNTVEIYYYSHCTNRCPRNVVFFFVLLLFFADRFSIILLYLLCVYNTGTLGRLSSEFFFSPPLPTTDQNFILTRKYSCNTYTPCRYRNYYYHYCYRTRTHGRFFFDV